MEKQTPYILYSVRLNTGYSYLSESTLQGEDSL
ncbi:hypothetical protein C21_02244 [Arenibacter sp. NBRC 103722]|nr:hypothetical protein C21_02244 [Arenibacter sp. NBRC 103722]